VSSGVSSRPSASLRSPCSEPHPRSGNPAAAASDGKTAARGCGAWAVWTGDLDGTWILAVDRLRPRLLPGGDRGRTEAPSGEPSQRRDGGRRGPHESPHAPAPIEQGGFHLCRRAPTGALCRGAANAEEFQPEDRRDRARLGVLGPGALHPCIHALDGRDAREVPPQQKRPRDGTAPASKATSLTGRRGPVAALATMCDPTAP
jgi:hypothetical protein